MRLGITRSAVFLCALIVMPWFVAADDATCTVLDHVVTTIDERWGEKCGSEDSFLVIVRNDALHDVRIQICVEKTNGSWDCGSSTEGPGATLGNWVCHGTGRVITRVRLADQQGRSCFPRDPATRMPLELSARVRRQPG